MYNSINPINITYRKPNQSPYAAQSYAAANSEIPVSADDKGKGGNRQEFPNGTKVAIDYSKNTINISQIVTDFKSTILAINAPDDISDEVSSYLSLVEKESKKANPSKEIIVSNLKNASKISDAYIAKSLNKPSKVVEGWIDALFMQKVELKADPSHINPDFQLDIPDKRQKSQTQSLPKEEQKSEIQEKPAPLEPKASQIQEEIVLPQEEVSTIPVIEAEEQVPDTPKLQLIHSPQNAPETQMPAPTQAQAQINQVTEQKPKPKYVSSPHDRVLSKSLKEAKTQLTLEDDPASALETLNDALGEATPDTNANLRAALHFERGKIFDDYDYVNYALRDYYEATKCDDDNLKSQAHFKMAQIYDDYVEYEPALEHYQDAIGYSAEADNLRAQTKILSEMAGMFAGRFEIENVEMLNNLSIDAAKTSKDDILLSNAYSNAAKNYEYVGEDFRALEHYKNAVKALENMPDDADMFEMRAQNYEDAARTMQNLGNEAKSESLLSKARLYRQRAWLSGMQEAG